MATMKAEYMRSYRQRNPAYTQENTRKTLARNRAMRRLAAAHRAEFFELFQDELRKSKPKPVVAP